MKRSDIQYQDCIKILEEELLPAMGCTEPIAVAYCAAVARETLGEAPDRVVVEASGNIIKKMCIRDSSATLSPPSFPASIPNTLHSHINPVRLPPQPPGLGYEEVAVSSGHCL